MKKLILSLMLLLGIVPLLQQGNKLYAQEVLSREAQMQAADSEASFGCSEAYYEPTAADYDLALEIFLENYGSDEAMLESQPDCYGTNIIGNVAFQGTPEHWFIQWDYIAAVPGGVREYSIPGAASSGRRGRADLANINSNEMFEIKPADNEYGDYKTLATYEVNHYIDYANRYCPTTGGEWHAGTNYWGARIFPHPTKRGNLLIARLTAPGVIQYDTEYVGYTPDYVPAFLPESLAEKLKNLVNRLMASPFDLEYQIVVFLRKNPQIVTYLKTAAVVIIIATVLEDVATCGVGITDDWISFAIARTLWRAASAL